MLTEIKQKLLLYFFEKQEELFKEKEISNEDIEDIENINDIWEEIKESLFTQYSFLEKLIILFNEIDLEEIEVNIKKILKLNRNDIIFPFSDGIKKEQNILFLDLYHFTENEEISEINLLANILLDENSLEYIFNSLEDNIILFLLKEDENFECNGENGNDESLIKSILGYLNIPYVKHIQQTDLYFTRYNNSFKCEKNYEQFDEILNIFHEYLNSKDPLWKFLLLYHIIENFAFRKPIVKHLRENHNQPLTVNQLSLVYEANNKESIIITNTIKDLSSQLDLDLNLSTPLFQQAKYILPDLGNSNLNNKQFGELIYKIRNSIVHNKETEWLHINHNILNSNEDMLKLFTEYLLPNLEKIVRYYIFNKNKEVDYLDNGPNYILLWGREAIR